MKISIILARARTTPILNAILLAWPKNPVISATIAPLIRCFVSVNMKVIAKNINAIQYNTTLDINNRVSIQYTVEDAERELAIFEMTHGNTKQNANDRKALMKKYKIKREDLDN